MASSAATGGEAENVPDVEIGVAACEHSEEVVAVVASLTVQDALRERRVLLEC